MNEKLKERLLDTEQARELLQIIDDLKAGKQEDPEDFQEVLDAMNAAVKANFTDEYAAVLHAFLFELLDAHKCGLPSLPRRGYEDTGKLLLAEGITHDVLAKAYEIYNQRHKGTKHE